MQKKFKVIKREVVTDPDTNTGKLETVVVDSGLSWQKAREVKGTNKALTIVQEARVYEKRSKKKTEVTVDELEN